MSGLNGELVNVAAFLEERAKAQSLETALIVPGARDPERARLRLTYRELAEVVAGYRARFAAAGIGRGTRTLVMVKMGLPLVGVNFALLGMGAIPVIIDPGMGLKGFLSCVGRTAPEALVGIPLAHYLATVFRGPFSTAKVRVRINSETGADLHQKQASDPGLAEIGKEDSAAVLFTSGSTGPAKGVVYTHGMFHAQVGMIRETFQIESGEIDFPMLPIFSLFAPALGMATVIPPMNPSRPAKANPAKVYAAMRGWKVTNSFGSPVLWGNLLRHCEATGGTLPDLRRILIAGAPVGATVLEGLQRVAPRAQIHTPYGATECLPVTTIEVQEILQSTAEETAKGAGTCVGRPVAGVSVKIVQSGLGPRQEGGVPEALPKGERGEIIATGPTVTRAYDQLPKATEAAKFFDGETVWHRMGDIGYLDGVGRLWFCGRAAERVRMASGVVLDTDCVEAVVNRVEGVYRSALIPWGEGGAAMVLELKKKSGVRKKAVKRQVKAVLERSSETAGIETILVADAFPVDVRHNAKINRGELAKRFFKG